MNSIKEFIQQSKEIDITCAKEADQINIKFCIEEGQKICKAYMFVGELKREICTVFIASDLPVLRYDNGVPVVSFGGFQAHSFETKLKALAYVFSEYAALANEGEEG